VPAEGNDRRGEGRVGLPLSVRVQGHNPDGTAWEQMTVIKDASSTGSAFVLPRALPRGDLLQLSLRLPKRFRRHDFAEPTYHVHAVVRHAAVAPGGAVVGVRFVGKHPPQGNPRADRGAPISDPVPAPSPGEHRSKPRFDIFINVNVRCTDPGGEVAEALGVVTNLAATGAALMTSLPLVTGQRVDLREIGGPFETPAEVRHVSIGEGTVRHVSVQFVGDEARVQQYLRRLGIPP
jgi:hypothetical protein